MTIGTTRTSRMDVRIAALDILLKAEAPMSLTGLSKAVMDRLQINTRLDVTTTINDMAAYGHIERRKSQGQKFAVYLPSETSRSYLEKLGGSPDFQEVEPGPRITLQSILYPKEPSFNVVGHRIYDQGKSPAQPSPDVQRSKTGTGMGAWQC